MPSPVDPPKQNPKDFLFDVFVSYSNKDSVWVRNVLVPCMEKEGLRVCIDYRDFEIGVPSLVNMERAVDFSRKTLLVLTPNWLASEWADFEALLVQTKDPVGRGRRMLPLMLEKTNLPDRLKVFTYLDLTNPTELDFQMKRLTDAIRSAPSQTRPTPPTHASSQRRSITFATGKFDYHHGLKRLSDQLAQADVDIRLSFSVLESRLIDNLQDERRYGSTEMIRSDRARIVEELNRLSLANIRQTYTDLCKD